MFTISIILVILVLTIVTLGDPGVLEVANQHGCHSLHSFVTSAGLKHTLDSAKDVTLFAPTDSAFAALPSDVVTALTKNTTLLADVLKYHVVGQSATSSDLHSDQLLSTLSGTNKLRVNIYNNGQLITIEGSGVVLKDLKAANGVVHIIDKVIYPIPSLSTPLFVTFDKDLNNIGYLAYTAKLIDVLSEQGLTLFAPSNEALEKISGQEYNNLVTNFTKLRDVVKFHAVKGTFYSTGLTDGQKLTTLEGKQLVIQIRNGVVTVNGAHVIKTDISTTNGVIHVIDRLLIPPTSSRPVFSLFDVMIPIIG